MIAATIRGFRKALGAPQLIVAAWLLTVLAALPVTLALGYGMQRSFGRTLASEQMADRFDVGWYGEYSGDARGIESTFDPTAAGVGGVLSNLERWAHGSLIELPPELVATALLFVLAWALFLGGAIERYAFPDTARGVAGALAGGGRYWIRFLRLALLSGAVYFGVYRLHRWAIDLLETRLVDVTQETRAIWATLALYVATAIVLVTVRACFDYAKIAIVIENRRSVCVAAVQGAAFVATHPRRALGLVLLVALVSALPLGLYLWIRPTVLTPGWSGVIYGVLVGQAWIVARVTLRLALIAGQVALYRAG